MRHRMMKPKLQFLKQADFHPIDAKDKVSTQPIGGTSDPS
jgi:hypothetical protein